MKKVIALLLVVLMLTTVFVGCSKNEPTTDKPSETKTPDPGSVSETPEQIKELTKIRVALPHAIENLDDACYWAATYCGFFEEEGIEVELLSAEGDYTAMIASGAADVGFPAPSAIFPALASGMELYVVFQQFQTNIFGIAVREDSDIKEWGDLVGKSIVTWPDGYMFSDPFLNAAGVDPKTVEYVPAYDQRAPFIQVGTADAALTWQIEWQMWDAQGEPLRYFDGDEVLPMCSNAVCCTPEYYENNKELIKGFGRALAKGIYFCEVNPLAAAAITVAKLPGLGLTAEEAEEAVKAIPLVMTTDDGQYGIADMERWKTSLYWVAYYGDFEETDFDLNTIIKANEFADAFNDWDRDEVKAIAENFDISSIQW